MTPEIAKIAMQFLMRVQLQGSEVPAFNALMQALSEAVETNPGEEKEVDQS